jgi:hypothetical protein
MELNARSLKNLKGAHPDLVRVVHRATYGSRRDYKRKLHIKTCMYCAKNFDAVGKGNKGCCSLECRFWSKVDRCGKDKCWPWTGSLVGGYGTFRMEKSTKKSHRVAFKLTHARWPLDNALHTCDNPRCCNPGHLLEGSHADNMADMKAKGRARSIKGSRNKNAKITENDVREIRTLGLRVCEIVSRFDIGKSTASAIKRGKAWRHVNAV